MESEVRKEAVNAGQCISTCSAVGVLPKGEILHDTKSVLECSSNSNISDNVGVCCEIERSVTFPGEECNSLEGVCEIRDGKCLKDHLDGNTVCTLSSESAENRTGSLSGKNLSDTKPDVVAPLSPIGQKAARRILMNLAETTSCDEECESLAPSATENTSFQSIPIIPSVNFLSLNVPCTEDIQIGAPITDDESGNKELVNSVSNNGTNNFGTSSSPNDVLVSKNLDELTYRGQDINTPNDDNPVDQNGKGIINMDNVCKNLIEGVFKESSRGNSQVPSKSEESTCSFPNDGAKIYDISFKKDPTESDIVGHTEMNQGEECDSEINKPFDICRNYKNENPQFVNCTVNNMSVSEQSELRDCNKVNEVISEDGMSVSLVSEDYGVCHVSNENMHSFAGISGSNELTAVVSNGSCQGPFNYRDSSESSSESELIHSSDDESVTEITDVDETNRKHGRRPEPVCHGEIQLTDLPPIEDLNICVPEEECIKIGEISSIVGELAVIQALPNTPALDIDSVLFLDHGKTTLGKIFDVLGPVKEPFYTVRFNSEHHARERGVTVGVDVFCAPRTDHTSYVFLTEMMKMKGSDASWEHNNEPPPLCVDYSDDEQERLARRSVAHQRQGDDRDGGPPRKKRGIRNRMGNSNQFNSGNRGNFVDSARPDLSPVRGYFSQSIPHATSYPPLLPPRPVFPTFAQRVPGGYTGRYNSPLMLGGPPPNFRSPMRTGYNNPLFEAPLRNFASSATSGLPPNQPPPMNSPPPYFIRPFHMLPSVPLVPLPPLPPYLSSPHVRPILCPPRFRPPMDDKRGPGNF
ncbi:hypothetical protein J437_LFUL006391 [Ladona fulva]|uniref:H/ACA ribonucleoprotein complex non-core subunit NAF1 n=1 Tax=Ladona fulva TaxID=123851 RepID=A0A8K0NZY0_LADFU|nr:hypothetical protein J437_LFUL006391 [Ladona fulva]